MGDINHRNKYKYCILATANRKLAVSSILNK